MSSIRDARYERAKFEQYAAQMGYRDFEYDRIDGDGYHNASMNALWLFWVASRDAAPAEPATDQGYVSAFYALAMLMGISARPVSPETVWKDEMLPRLKVALAAARVAEPVAYRYKDSRGHWRYVGTPFTPGWEPPPNLVREPLYSHEAQSRDAFSAGYDWGKADAAVPAEPLSKDQVDGIATASLVGLSQSGVVAGVAAHVDQGVTRTTADAQEVEAVPVNLRLDSLEHHSETAGATSPHGDAPVVDRHRNA